MNYTEQVKIVEKIKNDRIFCSNGEKGKNEAWEKYLKQSRKKKKKKIIEKCCIIM